MKTFKCCCCGSEKLHTRLPIGWKDHGGEVYCKTDWASRFLTRAVTLAVAGPAEDGNPTEKEAAWKELRERLSRAWSAAGRLANWSVTQLLKNDSFRVADQKKMAKMPITYLYGLFGQYPDRSDWDGGASIAQSVMRSVEQDWRSDRYSVLWEASRSPRTYKFPAPLPVPAQNWSCSINEQGIAVVSLGCPGGRINVRLVNDRTAGYQRARLRMLANGEVRCGEACIYAVPSNSQHWTSGMTIRARRGRDRMPFRVMVKLIGSFPKNAALAGELAGILRVRTGRTSFLIAEQDGHEPWRLNGDDIRLRIVGHMIRLQRGRDDAKKERRYGEEDADFGAMDMSAMCSKHDNWKKSMMDRVSSELANLAQRRRVAVVEWDDTIREFLPKYPWYEFREMVRRKLDERGILMTNTEESEDE